MINSNVISLWSIDPYYQSSSILDHVLAVFMRYFQFNGECIIIHDKEQKCCPKRLNEGNCLLFYRRIPGTKVGTGGLR